MQKLLQIKEKIVETIRQRGPELPVRIASLIGQNNLFTSAFMSELAGEQRIKISNMKKESKQSESTSMRTQNRARDMLK